MTSEKENALTIKPVIYF